MSNGFGPMAAYNRTTTSGFMPASAGGPRPLTQGGLILKNQQLMNDNNILKGELDQVSKEDLRERLVVAEMVMKKLFQRNRDLEDQNANSSMVQRVNSPGEFESVDVSNNGVRECRECVEVRKEMAARESEMQERINEL
jgi:hypothetical protein